MNSDSLAPWYHMLEYAAFGRRLEHHRCHFLGELRSAQCALVLGDGDGRFLLQLAAAYPEMDIDCVELSSKMIELSRKRLQDASVPNLERIRFHCADARVLRLPAGRYDLVVSHFFLDCLTTAEVDQLCGRLALACRPGARWLVSEFQQPTRGWPAWHARFWLKTMYAFFHVATGLAIGELPAYASALGAIRFQLQQQYTSRAALITSELWIRLPVNNG